MELLATFEKGMNMDNSKIAYPQGHYLYAENLRPITEEGLTNLSLSNVKGTLPLTIAGLPVRSGYSIVASKVIQKDIIVFLSNPLDTNPKDIIELYKYLPTNDSYTAITLWEGDGLGFSTGKVYSIVAKYESQEIVKIYWTDGVSSLKYANIGFKLGTTGLESSNYEAIFGIAISEFDFVPKFESNLINFDSYIGGNLLPGVIQYAYRLFKKNGNVTAFSEASELFPIINPTTLKGIPDTFKDTSGVGIRLKLTLTDYENFDFIEVISIYYSSYNAQPTIKKLTTFAATANIIIEDGGNNNEGELSLLEYRLPKVEYSAKTLATKDNRLFLGNVTEDVFNVNTIAASPIDTRIYAYNSELDAAVTSNSGATTLINNYTDVPLTADAINPDFNRFKYTSTGALGAEGSLFRLTYDYEAFRLYDNSTKLTSTVSSFSSDFISHNITSAQGVTPMGISIVPNIDYFQGTKKLLKADEIYRFGIVFKSIKGQNSFVYWLADIKMPSWKDVSRVDSSGQYGIAVIPKVSLKDISLLPASLRGLSYQLVYVERTEENKSILCQGIIENAGKYSYDTELNQRLRVMPGFNQSSFNGSKVHCLISPEIYYKQNVNKANVYLSKIGNVSFYNSFIADPASQMSYAYKQVFNTTVAISPVDKVRTTVLNKKQFNTQIGKQVIESILYQFDNVNTYAYYSRDKFINDNDDVWTFAKLPDHIAFYLGESKGDFFCDLKRDIIQYGGNTYIARINNTYIPLSAVKRVGADLLSIYGDTFLQPQQVLRNAFDVYAEYDTPSKVIRSNASIMYYVAESSINTMLSTTFKPNYYASLLTTTPKDYYLAQPQSGIHIIPEKKDGNDIVVIERIFQQDEPLYGYNTAYSQANNSEIFIADNPELNVGKTNSALIRYSNLKFSNELKDSFLVFSPNDFAETDGNLGQINRLIYFKDNIYVFQEQALSIAAINERAVVPTELGVPLELGTGATLGAFKYLTTEIGLQDNSDVIVSKNSMYWLDGYSRKLYRLGSNGLETLSDLKGISAYFKNTVDNDTKLIGTIDSKFNEVLFTIANYSSTLATTTEDVVVTNLDGIFTLTVLPSFDGNVNESGLPIITGTGGTEYYHEFLFDNAPRPFSLQGIYTGVSTTASGEYQITQYRPENLKRIQAKLNTFLTTYDKTQFKVSVEETNTYSRLIITYPVGSSFTYVGTSSYFAPEALTPQTVSKQISYVIQNRTYFDNRLAQLEAFGTTPITHRMLVSTPLLNLRKGVEYELAGGVFKVEDVDLRGITKFVYLRLISGSPTVNVDFDISKYVLYKNNTTLVFNELLDAFTSFYTFNPTLYINVGNKVFSASDWYQLQEHNKGLYNEFYNNTYDSTLDLVLSSQGQVLEYNNITAFTEVYDEILALPNETFSSVKVWNDYQESDEVRIIPMSIGQNVLDGSGYKLPANYKALQLANARKNIGKWNLPVPRHRSDFDEYTELGYGQPLANRDDSSYKYYETSDRIRNFYSIFRFTFNPINSTEEFVQPGTFILIDMGSDANAYSAEQYNVRKKIQRIDTNPLASGDYNLLMDWGSLGITTPYAGTLGIGEGLVIKETINDSQTLTGIVGAYSIAITGSVEETIELDVLQRTATFTLVETTPIGTDANAYTDQDFVIRKTLTRTDTHPSATGDYNLLFTYPGLTNNPFSGTLGIGQSVNIVSTKLLTGISGSYTVGISGSVTDNVIRNVTEALPTEYLEFLIDTTGAAKTFSLQLQINGVNDYKIRYSDELTSINLINGINSYTYANDGIHSVKISSMSNNFSKLQAFIRTSGMVLTKIDFTKLNFNLNILGSWSLNNYGLPLLIMPIASKLYKINLADNQLAGNLDLSWNLERFSNEFTLKNNIGLTSITFNESFISPISKEVDVSNCSLDVTTIDRILKACADTGISSGVNRFCNLNGGTNATPSAAGIINRNLLLSRGWSVPIN